MRNLFSASAILASLVILAPQAEAGMRGTNHNRYSTKASTSQVVYVVPAAPAAAVAQTVRVENSTVAGVQVQSQPVAASTRVVVPTSPRSPAVTGRFIRFQR